jgi:uncharacterized protein (UPF0333 family)
MTLKKKSIKKENNAQVAIEYMLLLGVIVAIVLVGFNRWLPRVFNSADSYYNLSTNAIVGKASRCGDTACTAYENNEKCCVDCGGCGVYIP